MKTKLLPVCKPDAHLSSENLPPIAPYELKLPCPALCIEHHPTLDIVLVGLFGGDFILLSPTSDDDSSIPTSEST